MFNRIEEDLEEGVEASSSAVKSQPRITKIPPNHGGELRNNYTLNNVPPNCDEEVILA